MAGNVLLYFRCKSRHKNTESSGEDSRICRVAQKKIRLPPTTVTPLMKDALIENLRRCYRSLVGSNSVPHRSSNEPNCTIYYLFIIYLLFIYYLFIIYLLSFARWI